MNNLSLSPISEEFRMVSRGYINLKYTDWDYNKCIGPEESFGHYPFCPSLNNQNDGDYEG